MNRALGRVLFEKNLQRFVCLLRLSKWAELSVFRREVNLLRAMTSCARWLSTLHALFHCELEEWQNSVLKWYSFPKHKYLHSYSHNFWPMTLNKQLPWTVVWVSLPVQRSYTSVQLIWQESVKQLSTTPLNSFEQGKSWQHACIEIQLAKSCKHDGSHCLRSRRVFTDLLLLHGTVLFSIQST